MDEQKELFIGVMKFMGYNCNAISLEAGLQILGHAKTVTLNPIHNNGNLS